MKTKTPQQLGTEFQNDVQAVLKPFQNISRTYFHRLYDSKSAGGYLPSQPGDFVCVHEGRPVLIEAKSSGNISSFSQSREFTGLFDSEQLLKMRLWVRAGGSASVIFQCQKTKALEVWDGVYIADCFNTPRCRPDKDMAYAFKKGELNAACLFILKGRMR